MTKQKLNIARLILVAVLVVTLVSAIGLVAFAEETATAQTREFNESFDRMLNNGGGEDSTPAYRSVNFEAGQCISIDDPILKFASGAIVDSQNAIIKIEMRSSNLTNADLKITLRENGDQTLETYLMSDEKIQGALDGFELGTEWSTLEFDFTQVDSKVNPLAGIHIYAKDNTVSGNVDIRKVSLNNTVLLDFAGTNNTWWWGTQDGTFVDHPACQSISDSKAIASEVAAENNLDGEYNAIVLKIKGTGNVTLAPVTADGEGAAKAWTALTDLEGTAVAAIGQAYANHVISLTSLGAKEIKGVKIAVTGGSVDVAQVFFTNMESRDPDKYFPVIDMNDVVYLSKFDMDVTIPSAWSSDLAEKFAPYGLDYIISQQATSPSTVSNGHAVLEDKGGQYTNFKVRGLNSSDGRRYLVIKYKLQNGASLDKFRFDLIQADSMGKVTYLNKIYAGFGLLSTSELNPYKATAGYQYLVVDMLETFGVTNVNGVEFYFDGEGQILIDEVFYAHPQVNATKTSDNLLPQEVELTVPEYSGEGDSYKYLAGYDLDGKYHDGLELILKGSEGANLDDIRLEMGGATLWFTKNANLLKDIYGREMPALTEEYQVYSIDFAQSGVTGALTNLHIHSNMGDEARTITIQSCKFIDYDLGELKSTGEILGAPITKVFGNDAPGYDYVGGFDVPNLDDKQFAIMEMEVEGDISELRLEMAGGTYWIKDNALSLRDADGNLFDAASTAKRTLVIDLKQSHVTGNITNVHIHNNFAAKGDTVTVSSVKFKGYTDMVVSDELVAEPVVVATENDYDYIKGMDVNATNIPQKLVLKVSGDISKMRLEFVGAGKTLWFADNAQGTLLNVDGKAFDIENTDERTLVIDFAINGIYYPISTIHVHSDHAIVTLSSAVYYSAPVGYEAVVIPVNDDSKPVIAQSIATSGTVGTEIAVAATATDNYDGDVEVAYKVMLGATEITLTNGKFTPTAAGTYAVEITATDAAGNVAKETVSIVVAAAPSSDPGTDPGTTDPTPDTDGLPTGAIVGIVLGCVAVVAAGVVAFILIRKKNSGK